MKELNFQSFCNFELSNQENTSVSIWIFLVFQQRDRQDSQKLNKVTFCRMPVTSTQCIIGTEKYPYAGILLNYDDADYSDCYGQTKEAFRALTKDEILKPYISDHDFRSSDVRADDVCYNLHVFDVRYQQNFTASQPIKVEFKLDGVVPSDVNGYALVLTNKLASVSSDGQRQYELIKI